MNLKNKKGFEFSFGWLFALLVGAVVLFLALYAATQLVGTLRFQQETEIGKTISILLSPIETNLASSVFAKITVPQETKIFNRCSPYGDFGSQKISTAIKTSFNKEWDDSQGVESTTHNKYLFSPKEITAKKEFYVISKPFKLPFKLADMIILWSDSQSYCFEQIPNNDFKDEIKDLAPPNLFLENCPADAITVCIKPSTCQIVIDINEKTVKKDGEILHYEDSSDASDKYALLLSAIFSEPETYKCQIKRILKRADALAEIYKKKSLKLNPSGTRLPSSLSIYQTTTREISQNANPDISQITSISNQVEGDKGAMPEIF